jgi:hypothetical protein
MIPPKEERMKEVRRIRDLLIPFGLENASLLGHTIRVVYMPEQDQIFVKVFGIGVFDGEIFKIGEFSEKDAEKIFTDVYSFEREVEDCEKIVI